MRIKYILLFVSSLSFLIGNSTPAFSASRPGNANPSSALAHGYYMIESGTDIMNDFSSYIQIRYGRNDGEINYVQPIDASGSFTLGSLSLTRNLLSEKGFLPDLALHLTINDLSYLQDISCYLPFSHSLKNDFSIGGQLGVSTYDNSLTNLSSTLYLGKGVNDKTWTFIEVYGNTENEIMFDCGITYMLKNNIQIDTNFGLPLVSNDSSSFFQLGIAWMSTR